MKLGLVCAVVVGMLGLAGTSDAGTVVVRIEGTEVLEPGQGYQTDSALFSGGEPAVFAAEGDGTGDIDCAVFDARGNIVTQDVDDSDTCLLIWRPQRTGRYFVRFANFGEAATLVEFMSN